MANRYKNWKPPISITPFEFDDRLEKEFKDGWKYTGSFRDIIVFENIAAAKKEAEEFEVVKAKALRILRKKWNDEEVKELEKKMKENHELDKKNIVVIKETNKVAK